CLAHVGAPNGPEAAVKLEIRVDFSAALRQRGPEQPAAAPADDAPVERLLADRLAPGERHLIFSLADGDCAVPAAQVLQVDRPPERRRGPNVPDWVLGVANARGDIISLVDLRGFLGLPPPEHPGRSRVVVVRSRDAELTTGLVVDRVVGMRVLDR